MCFINTDGKKWKLKVFDKLCNLVVPPDWTDRTKYKWAQADLGLDPQDAKGANMDTLAEAINDGYKIFMDLDSVLFTRESSTPITEDIYIIASPKRPCSISWAGIDVLFTVKSSMSNISFENLKFSNNTNQPRLLYNDLVDDGILALDSLNVQNCEFDQVYLMGLSPDRLYYGGPLSYIKKIKFINNKVFNAPGTFANIIDVQFDLVEIKNNYVNNFYFILFNFGTSNLPSNYTPEEEQAYNNLQDNKKRIEVFDNTVINDLDWVQTRVSTLYHTFVLGENQEFIYKNNYVEGLKASINIATYDFYANCPYVLSENNVWKNNLCWAADSDNNTLMKAKGGDGQKIFRNNQYYITPEFVQYIKDNYNAPEAGLWVDFISITDHAKWKVYNNIIDIAIQLKLFRASPPASAMYIGSNKITALYFQNAIIGKHPTLESTWLVENNIFEETATSFEESDGYYLLTTVSEMPGTATLKNNIFNTPYATLVNSQGSENTPGTLYTAENNLFRLSRTRNIQWTTLINNTFIQEHDSEAGFAGNDDMLALFSNSNHAGITERKVKLKIDNRKTLERSRFIYLEFYKNRACTCDIKFTFANRTGDSIDRHALITVTKEGHITVYDEITKKEIYNGLLYPSTKVSTNLSNGFKAVLYPPEDGGTSRLEYAFTQVLFEGEMIMTEEA